MLDGSKTTALVPVRSDFERPDLAEGKSGVGARSSAPLHQRVLALLVAGFVAVAGLEVASGTAGAAGSGEADLALVLALDCSASVDDSEFHLQIEGLAQAFESTDVAEIVAAGPRHRIAVAILEFATAGKSVVVQPWTLVGGDIPVADIAGTIRRVKRQTKGVTSLSDAIAASIALFSSLPVPAARKTIDISTDGINNDGPRPEVLRDQAVSLGIVVNGLTILTDYRDLDVYFEHHVMGGRGSFAQKAKDYRDYRIAIKRKLLRELAQPVS